MNPQEKANENHKYAGTLNLPETDFPMRANASQREPTLLKDVYQLYKWQEKNNTGELWVTHDGPPYANGDLHLGHVLNKVLKDFVNRYKMMRGFRVSYIPGWDCHGLPIELKALERLKGKLGMTPQEIRSVAREFALKEVEKQMVAFKSWGVMGDWENPYLTLHRDYEAAQIALFCDMFSKGFVYRGVRPVHWSPSSLTALADAELEYNEAHKSTSVYVPFRFKYLSPEAEKIILPVVSQQSANISDLYAVIWTTTPWTLPSNVALCAHENISYVVARAKNGKDPRFFVVAEERVESLGNEFDMEFTVLCAVKGHQLEESVCVHPFCDRDSPLVLGDHVTTQTGTGLVHTAPGHGEEDFVVGKKYNLPVLSPVGDNGRFTDEAGALFAGKDVLSDGNAAVIVPVLKERNALLKEKQVIHKYPYDWRTKKPVIVRTTPQWFVNLEQVQNPSVEAIENQVHMTPSTSTARMVSMLGGRNAWCISRQRSWGVPIPVFYDDKGNPLVTQETVSHVEHLVRQYGTDCWWNLSVEELLPPSYRANASNGSSWRAVLVNRGIRCPADLYLEGSDQHRGWFQSSLLTSMCLTGKAPYKNVATHGFILDEKGRKMSKSVGNVIPPSLIIHGGEDLKREPANHIYGVDVLRLFVASSDYTHDLPIGPKPIERIAEALRQLRNKLRFLLSNTNDFVLGRDGVPYSDLKEVDKYLLLQLYKLGTEVNDAYDKFNFAKVYKLVTNFSNLDLSAFYFELIKRRLYTESPKSVARRSSQTVLSFVLEVLLKSLAPLLPHTVEDVFRHWKGKPYEQDSVFCTGWFELREEWKSDEHNLATAWSGLTHVREAVNKMLENMRGKRIIGRPEDADLDISLSESLQSVLLRNLSPSDLAEVFLVSNVNLCDNSPNADVGEYFVSEVRNEPVKITTYKSKYHKCPRCWRSVSAEDGQVCPPCLLVLKQL